jgi:CshA-type fibril repeat protein
MQPDGSYVFAPAPGFTGPVPPVKVTVTSSDGQIKEVPLTITVNPMLRDGNEEHVIPAGTPSVTLNLLDNVSPPPGTTVAITSFTLPGSTKVYPVGLTPVTVTDPTTGRTAGTVAVQADGTATFTPASGFTGQAPPVTYTVVSSDGQTSPGALSVTVQPGALCRLLDRVQFIYFAWWFVIL